MNNIIKNSYYYITNIFYNKNSNSYLNEDYDVIMIDKNEKLKQEDFDCTVDMDIDNNNIDNNIDIDIDKNKIFINNKIIKKIKLLENVIENNLNEKYKYKEIIKYNHDNNIYKKTVMFRNNKN